MTFLRLMVGLSLSSLYLFSMYYSLITVLSIKTIYYYPSYEVTWSLTIPNHLEKDNYAKYFSLTLLGEAQILLTLAAIAKNTYM